MHDFTVLDVARSESGTAVCLVDAAGGFHVARATATVPPVGARLLGNRPAPGFSLLLGEPVDQVFRMIFEEVHCTQEQAQQSLHGPLMP